MTRTSAILGKVWRLLAKVLLVLLGLATLGSFMPAIPLLGELGPILTGLFGPWLAIIALIGAIAMVRTWRLTRRKGALVIACLAMFTVIGTVVILARQMAVARANGVEIDLGQVLLPSGQIDASLRPVTIDYTAYQGQQIPLEIYAPPAREDGRLAPTFVYIHGGGWSSQDLRQRQADYRWFAERGYLVVSLEYTLSTPARHTWNVATPQLGCALAWLESNAARYGGDVSRLALWGESAGGNLALNVSYLANQGKLRPSCPGTLPKVRATIALYPVVNPVRMYRPVDPLLGLFGRMMGDSYTGGSPEQYPDRYAAIASATHISAQAPPTLLIVPESDHLVDPQAAYAFEAKAKAAGVETSLIKFPFAEHAFDLRSGSVGNQLVRQTMLRFLFQHGMKP